MNKLIAFLERILDWLIDLLLWVPRKIWELATDGLATFVEWLPVPDFMANLGNFIGDIDPAIAYFAAPLQLETGITFVVLAYVLRFAIRRVPVIG